jgi:hypothetical protein
LFIGIGVNPNILQGRIEGHKAFASQKSTVEVGLLGREPQLFAIVPDVIFFMISPKGEMVLVFTVAIER